MASFASLPRYLLESILIFLDFPDIYKVLTSNKAFFELFTSKTLWKSLLLRDFLFFFLTNPIKDQSLLSVSNLSIKFMPLESSLDYPPDYKLKRASLEEISSISSFLSGKSLDFLQFRYQYYVSLKLKSSNLSGLWIGDYSSHGLETLRIYNRGFELFAVKITGDINVPAGKMTWKVIMNEDFKYGRGFIHIADIGFINPRWATTEIEVLDPEKLIVSSYFPHLDKWFKVSLGCSKLIKGNETSFMSIKIMEIIN